MWKNLNMAFELARSTIFTLVQYNLTIAFAYVSLYYM